MALSDYDKKYLDKRQQQAVLTYTAQYERAIREGNQKAAQMAHEGAESIRRLAGYSGGAEGNSFLKPAAAVSKTISVSTNGKTSYQTVPAASGATVERADELPTPSATRQDKSSRGGGFGSTRAGGFGGTGGSTSLATRIGQGAVSGLAEAGALLSATAGTVMDVRGGTGMTPVYREQTQALTRQIDALEKELHDPALTARERQDANDALRIAREQRNVYTQATAANQGTAQKLYETTDEGLRYAREQAEKSVRGTSGLEREVLSRVPGMTQSAAITGFNLVAPWLGTTTAVLADAGAAETRYRHDSGADYDAKAAAALGARVIGGDTAGILAGELVRDYAETLRELYAERRRQAAPPQLAEPDRPRLPQSAYADALSRLEDSNGTDLTKPVSAYSAPPSVIELPETVGASATQTAYDAMQPNSVLEAFLPTKNYISKDGAFRLEAANADYGKIFLPTVPEKNRMYLQQAADAVDFLMTDDPRITLGYDVKTDAIIYNPSGPTFSSYDWDNVLTHELAHRIDWWFADSIGNENFIREIAAAKFTPAKTWENLVGYCWRNDKEGYLSDIIGALSESEYDLPFYHERSYWNEKKKAAETFANLFSLESLGDMEKLSTLKNAFPRLLQAYESLDFSLQTR